MSKTSKKSIAPRFGAGFAHRAKGFTLVELMVAVSIVAILAAIAIPAYNNYILRSNIPNATNGLSASAAQMEQFFQDWRSYQQIGASPQPPCVTNSTYGNFTVSCNPPANPPAAMTAAGLVAGVTATTYTLVAVGNGSMAGFTYVLNSNPANPQWSQAGAVWGSQTCPNTWIQKNGTC